MLRHKSIIVAHEPFIDAIEILVPYQGYGKILNHFLTYYNIYEKDLCL